MTHFDLKTMLRVVHKCDRRRNGVDLSRLGQFRGSHVVRATGASESSPRNALEHFVTIIQLYINDSCLFERICKQKINCRVNNGCWFSAITVYGKFVIN